LNYINSNGLPIGKVVEDIGPLQTPAKREYLGEFVTLQPVEPERDVDELFLNSHGSDVKQRIWTYMAYGPFSTVHHTKVDTEVVYLMLREIFDGLNYRRVEWKCDALNTRSRAAALRLGFSFEGIFRQNYIIKDRNRDTAWFSMIDKDWPDIKTNMEKWLYSDESDISLSAINKPLLNPTCKAI
jgi:hypothetical protein